MTKYTNTNQDVDDIITDEFHDLKSLGLIEDWVEASDDLYLDQDGSVYAVQHYHSTYYQTEGHGMHTHTESFPDMRTAILVVTQPQIIKALNPEVFYNISI